MHIFPDKIDAFVFWLVYAMWTVPTLLSVLRTAKGQQARRDDRGSLGIVVVLISAGLFAAFAIAVRRATGTITSSRQLVFELGLLLELGGLVIRTYAVRLLGAFFTSSVTTQDGQTVIDYSLYKWIRHPVYAGSLMTNVGVGLALMNWLSTLVILVTTFLGYAYRINVEEQLLTENLGEPYADYKKHTKRLIPFVY